MEGNETKRGFGVVEAIITIMIYLVMMVFLTQTFNSADCGGNVSCSNFSGVTRLIMTNLPLLSAVGGIVMTAALFGLISTSRK